MKRRVFVTSGPPPPTDCAQPGAAEDAGYAVDDGDVAQLAASGGHLAARGAGNGPVIVLSYAYSGADHVQNALAAGAELACTSGTGIIPLCSAAAETWRRIEGQHGAGLSRLAAGSIRVLATVQVTMILASAGQSRWCELASVAPAAAEPFLQLFPQARFVCVYRSCPDVIRAGVQASPWGLHGQSFAPYLLAHSGNSVAALAAYWANSTEQLLSFEQANREASLRIRYEDVAAFPDQALRTVRAELKLSDKGNDSTNLARRMLAQPDPIPPVQVPAELIPEPLRQRISDLHAKLGYSPSVW